MPTRDYQRREGKVYSMGIDSRVMTFHSPVCNPQFSSGVPFGMLSKGAFRLLSGGLLTFFHVSAEFAVFPHTSLYKASSDRLLSFISLWVSPGYEQTTLRKDISHLPVPKPISLYKASILCTPQAFARTMQLAWHHHTLSAFPKILV